MRNSAAFGDSFRTYADSDEAQVLRGGKLTDPQVGGFGVRSELTHFSEHHDSLCAIGDFDFREGIDRRLHGLRVGVVGIVKEGACFEQLAFFAIRTKCNDFECVGNRQ